MYSMIQGAFLWISGWVTEFANKWFLVFKVMVWYLGGGTTRLQL